MKLIKPSFEIIEQGPTVDDVYKHIEKCGRTCYKSEDKITEGSAKGFVDRLIKSEHYAMLEHATIYLGISIEDIQSFSEEKASSYFGVGVSPYSKFEPDYCGTYVYCTTNMRVLVENKATWLLEYIVPRNSYHHRRVTVHFICNRQVSHEFVRHRVFSFAQESTRYCNYCKDKFGNELTFIEPCWLSDTNIVDAANWYEFEETLKVIEKNYLSLIDKGWKPQEAATILPNALKTELIMTGFVNDWKHFFDLRALGTTGAPHPQAKELALPLMEEFKNLGIM